MATAFAQAPTPAEDDTGATTLLLAFDSNVAAGSLLWCVVSADSTSFSLIGVSDSLNGAWEKATSITQTSNNEQSELWYRRNSATGACTVTATWTGAATFRRLSIVEVSGCLDAAPDKVASAMGTSTAPDSGSETTTTDGQYIAGGLQINGTSISNQNGFTTRQLGTNQEAVTLDKTQITSGAINVSVTLAASVAWAALMATFEADLGPPAIVYPFVIPQRQG